MKRHRQRRGSTKFSPDTWILEDEVDTLDAEPKLKKHKSDKTLEDDQQEHVDDDAVKISLTIAGATARKASMTRAALTSSPTTSARSRTTAGMREISP